MSRVPVGFVDLCNRSVSNDCIVSYVCSDLSTVGNVSNVRSVSSVSNVSIVCNS